MSTTDHGHEPTDADHEHSDVSLRGVVIFIVVLAVVCAVSFVLMWMLYGYFERRAVANDPRPPALNMRARDVPPEPRLQINPAADLRSFRAAEEKKLHSYAWVDKEGRIVRIPIERAMELTAERGRLPVIPPAPTPAAPPASVPMP